MINVALFGCGRIGKVHAVNIASHAETNLYSVIDPYVEGAMALAEQYGAKVQSVEEAMTDENVHAVLIGSATDTHADLTILAAQHKKAIFCEKPIDLSLERVRECLKVVDEHKVPMLVGFNRRFDPQFAKVKEQLGLGVIGKAESLLVTSRDPSPPPAEYSAVSGGMFRDMTVHDFDMVRFIMGRNPISVYAQGSSVVDPEIGKAGDIDTATVIFEFEDGATATVLNSRRSGYGYDQRIELHGESGLLKANNMLENLVEVWGENGLTSEKPHPFFLERYNEAYKAEWNHFVDVITGRAECSCTGADGEFALVIAEAALESMATGKKVKIA